MKRTRGPRSPQGPGHSFGPRNPSRRRFLGGMAAAGGSLLLPGCGSSEAPGFGTGLSGGALPQLPSPENSGIDHIVVVMMENRSYDHFLGWVPNSDGIQAGLKYEDNDGNLHETFRLSTHPDYAWQGCGKEDPDHGYDGGHEHYNNGRMDAFLKTVNTPGDLFPIGYYTAQDLPFFKGVADHFTVCDRYFSGILSSTFPNRVHMHSGQTDRNSNTLPYAQQAPSTLPTIWDLLLDAGVDSRYYFSDLPLLGLWGPKYLDISTKYEQFLIDCAAGLLPAVSFIDPFFGFSAGESPYGISRDDHPQADVRDGQAFLAEIYNALRGADTWERTLLIINYDEWGGFYDHVPPPLAPITAAEAALGSDGRLGIRVPCVMLGPRVRRKHVSHLQFDSSSIHNLIRWRYNLGGLSPRDSSSLNMAYALNLDGDPNLDAPDFAVPTSPTGFGTECETGLPFPLPTLPSLTAADLARLDPVMRGKVEHAMEWDSLRRLAVATGWKL